MIRQKQRPSCTGITKVYSTRVNQKDQTMVSVIVPLTEEVEVEADEELSF